MLFNSPQFLFLFLPLTLLAFYSAATIGSRTAAKVTLIAASLIFYGAWNPANLPILLGSTIVNYGLGLMILDGVRRKAGKLRQKTLLIAGLIGNIVLIGYFKYTGMAVVTVNQIFSTSFLVPHIILPLGISFFTFQKIAFLIDVHDGQVAEVNFIDYCLFVFFFPQLISGPIVHHREIIPQFKEAPFDPRVENFCLGFTLLLIGLFKKAVIADGLAATADQGFNSIIHRQTTLGFFPSWIGMLSSTLQIYFDFSGYSDMAIGLGLLFGIRLPFNFNSPLKAHNMVELWTRWHMSLTRFLTAYIYNPIVLARSRRWASLGRPLPKKGKMTNAAFWALMAFPTIITMLIAGIWHGAGYQFVIFGFLNGLFMAICHKWRLFKQARGWRDHEGLLLAPAVLLTVLCYTFTLVFFKAPDIRSAVRMVGNLLGLRGFWGPMEIAPSQILILIALFAAVWLLPNSQEIMGIAPASGPSSSSPVSKWRLAISWRPTLGWAFGMGVVGFISLFAMALGRESPFLYFQF